MKRMVMFSIAMLVVSSTVFASQNIPGRSNPNISGKSRDNQGGGYHGGGVLHPTPGQGGGGIQQPVSPSALTPAMTTVAEYYMILAHAHHAKAIAAEELAKANSSARMKQVNAAESIINMELQKLNEARKMLPMVRTNPARTKLMPAQAEVAHNARMNINPAIMNLRPSANLNMLCGCDDGSMTGGGNATDTPGNQTGGTGHGSTQQQGNIGQGGAGQYHYQTMNPAESNVTNSARSQMTPARARN